jgi:hypothetical protein
MNPHPSLHRLLARLLAAAVFAFISSAALAQADPPGRVGRMNYSQGSVSFSPTGDNEWTEAQTNRPLTRGDRLWTDRRSRSEIQIGSSAVRLDGQTRLEIMVLDDQSAQLSLTQGSLYVRVRSLPDGENFEIDTPNLAYRAAYPGDYRIDVDAADGTTRVTIHSGTGAVYGEGGHALPLGGGQQVTFRGRSLAQVATQESPPQDAFDRWAAERNRQEDQSIAARYVPREVVGYQQLDAHGQWKKDATHGAVWFPQGTPANWAPYRNGRWEWIGPWGWTWIDDTPWGFAPFHYGRWALIESRWAWVPGALGLRPVYAPALVAFVGNTSGAILTSLSGRSSVAWFPLAPGEMWQPGFHASGAYISNVNRNMLPGPSDATYLYQRRPEALTAVSGDDFQRGRPAGAGWLRIAADALTNAPVVPPPAKPERTASAKAADTRPAAPAAQPEVRRVNSNPAPGAETGQRERAEQARAAEQAKVAEQAKAAQQAKEAEQAREAAQAKAAAQAEAAAQAKASERAKAVAQAKAAEQAKASSQARVAEQARRSEQAQQSRLAAQEQAKAAHQAKLDQQRKIAEPSRVAAQASAGERARRAEIARAEARQSRQTQRAQTAAREAAATRHAQARPAERNQQQRAELAKREQLVKREQQARRAETTRQEAQARRNERALAQARREEQQRAAAQARRNEELQRIAHAQRVEQVRRSAERDAQVLREQRVQREAQARREADEAQRQAQQRAQAAAEQLRRQQQAREEQLQLERARARPDLRDPLNRPPEIWQRGVPILNSGRTS